MLAQKICKMSNYLETREIAQALQIPENIVVGILNKTLDPSILDNPKAEIKIITDDGYEISALDAPKLKINRRKEHVTGKIEKEIQASQSSVSRTLWGLSILLYGVVTVFIILFIADTMGYENASYVIQSLKNMFSL